MGPDNHVSTVRPARLRVGQSQHCRDHAAKLLARLRDGINSSSLPPLALFARKESVESSSEIVWQRTYRILALNELQADKLKKAAAIDIIFELLAHLCVHLPLTSNVCPVLLLLSPQKEVLSQCL